MAKKKGVFFVVLVFLSWSRLVVWCVVFSSFFPLLLWCVLFLFEVVLFELFGLVFFLARLFGSETVPEPSNFPSGLVIATPSSGWWCPSDRVV